MILPCWTCIYVQLEFTSVESNSLQFSIKLSYPTVAQYLLKKKKVDERVGLDQIVRDELDTIKRATLSYLTSQLHKACKKSGRESGIRANNLRSTRYGKTYTLLRPTGLI